MLLAVLEKNVLKRKNIAGAGRELCGASGVRSGKLISLIWVVFLQIGAIVQTNRLEWHTVSSRAIPGSGIGLLGPWWC